VQVSWVFFESLLRSGSCSAQLVTSAHDLRRSDLVGGLVSVEGVLALLDHLLLREGAAPLVSFERSQLKPNPPNRRLGKQSVSFLCMSAQRHADSVINFTIAVGLAP
jgi:hypothetical protein